VKKLRNAPASIIAAIVLIGSGAGFNFVMGLIFSLAPEVLKGVENPITTSGAPTKLLLASGVACIAFGFVCIWVIRELANKSQLAIVMVYLLSGVNMLFGVFRLPLGFLGISIHLMLVFFIRSKSAKQWLVSP
jgi:hypothetical protein